MKKLYTSVLLLSLLSLGCSKDFLKPYDERIIGSWRISDVNRVGLGGSTSNLPFRSGTFTFEEGRSLQYVSLAGDRYRGSWDLVKKYGHDGNTRRTLQVTAVDFAGGAVLSEFYDDMNFVSTDHFKATKQSGAHSYITHFRRL